MKIKNIVFLINSMGSGGAERVVSLLIDDFIKKGLKVHLLVLNEDSVYQVNDKVIFNSLTKTSNKHFLVQLFDNFFIVPLRLKKYCVENNIDVVMSHLYRSNYANSICKVLGGRPLSIGVQHSHASNSYSSKSIKDRFNRILIKKLLPHLDAITTVSKVMRMDLHNSFKIPLRKLYYIGNPIEIEKIKLKSKSDYEGPIKDNDFTFISLGSFVKRKNHELIIKSAQRINSLKFNLVIMGRGELKDYYLNLIEKYGMKHKIKLIDFDENPFKFLANSHCLINSSNAEGLPMVMLESLACDLPIISTDCLSGPREILAPNSNLNYSLNSEIEVSDYGILTPTNDVDCLAEAMEFIIKNKVYRERLISNSKHRIAEFELKNISKEYIKLIDNIKC